MNSSKNASCWQLCKDLNIFPIKSQYIFSTANLAIYQKGFYYSGIKIYQQPLKIYLVIRIN